MCLRTPAAFGIPKRHNWARNRQAYSLVLPVHLTMDTLCPPDDQFFVFDKTYKIFIKDFKKQVFHISWSSLKKEELCGMFPSKPVLQGHTTRPFLWEYKGKSDDIPSTGTTNGIHWFLHKKIHSTLTSNAMLWKYLLHSKRL